MVQHNQKGSDGQFIINDARITLKHFSLPKHQILTDYQPKVLSQRTGGCIS
ncbi:MAG: hypothetical protein F6K00_24330 [Leptolyngbya sp. SIOISBB]|nr:hypothetical protein [Leptolyngbya sp. SIOISBB]